MIGDNILTELSTELIIPNIKNSIKYMFNFDKREHLEMYLDAFEKTNCVFVFSPNFSCILPDKLLLKKIDISHIGLNAEIIDEIIIKSSDTIEEIIIKTNNISIIDYIPIYIHNLPKLKKLIIYENISEEAFDGVLNIIRELKNLTEIKIYASDISGGNGGFFQTHITLIDIKMEVQVVLQFIITPECIQDIFDICHSISILNISENFNDDFQDYRYLFYNELTYPKTLTKIILHNQYNTEFIELAIAEISTLNTVHYSYNDIFSDISNDKNLKTLYPHINFVFDKN